MFDPFFPFQESLNESFSIVIGQKLPRSAESSMRRSAVARPRPEITLQVFSQILSKYFLSFLWVPFLCKMYFTSKLL